MLSPLRFSVAVLLALVALAPAAAAQDDDRKAREESARKTLEDFKAAIKNAKTLLEKAAAILAVGDAEWRDASLVGPVAKHLSPAPGDLNYVLPVAAAETLARFRGSAAAAQALAGALPSFKKIPYVHSRLFVAIGRVGHESSLPALEEPLKGNGAAAAVVAIEALSDFPAPLALDVLFREYDRMEKKKGGASDDVKAVIDRVQPEILKAVQKLSGEKYPTVQELSLWWQKRGPKFREESAAKEKARASGRRDPAEPRAVLPPVLIAELCFNEKTGNSTANTGSSSSAHPQASVTTPNPAWTEHAAPNGGGSALDFGPGAGAFAVDLGGGAGIEHLRNLKSFTICGWLVLRAEPEGPSDKLVGGGNRLVSWFQPRGEGVELVFRTDGSLQLGVNQAADTSPARSAVKQFPLLDATSDNIWGAVWNTLRFFAVTYDSTAPSGHVKFYLGSRSADAKAVTTLDYQKGPAGSKISPQLTIGNVGPAFRQLAPDRSFRGILDEIRIYGSTLDGSGALLEPQLVKIQNRAVPTAP
jgi:hypothetical protein